MREIGVEAEAVITGGFHGRDPPKFMHGSHLEQITTSGMTVQGELKRSEHRRLQFSQVASKFD